MRMHRSNSILLITLLLAIALDGESRAAKRPNVILIITDDQGYGDLRCHGNPVLDTPHLDQLYAESVRLANFHVDPTCSPTRAALMTGRYSTRTGVWHTVMGRNMPRRDEVMMPQLFAKSGYITAVFGKWHLGDNFPFRPQDRGFQHVLIHGGGGVGQIPDYWDNDYFDDTFFVNGRPKKFSGYCTDVFFREAIRFIEAHRDRPFFVYLPTNAPHGPFHVPEQYSQPYIDRVGDDAPLARFYGMIANIDENVGRLRRRLAQLDLADETLLIFMTDNGTSRGATFTDNRGNEGQMLRGYNAGMRGRKGSPYEGGHRVPCFLHWPAGGLVGGRDVDHLTAHLDLLPTMIEFCGLPPPDDITFDGRSLVPVLTESDRPWPQRTLFAHHQELPDPEKYRFGCVLDDSWRLVIRNDDRESASFELFDLVTDPGQRKNVADQHAAVAQRLRAEYDAWWDQLAEGFDQYARIVVGDPQQDPVQLTCFEWHSSRRWWQPDIRRGFADNGFWALQVAADGEYEISLRRWPPEISQPIASAAAGGKAIAADTARIRIGETEMTCPVEPGAVAVTFRLRLPSGPTRLETWFVGDDGQSRGAYYASVTKTKQHADD